MSGTINLIIVVVEAGNVGSSELGDLARGATDTAADIKNLHAFLDAHAQRKVVFVASDGLVERLAGGKAAEMERLAPAVLVQVGGEVVITMQAVRNLISGNKDAISNVRDVLSSQSGVLGGSFLHAILISMHIPPGGEFSWPLQDLQLAAQESRP